MMVVHRGTHIFYITQFEMLAQLNHWTEMEKATLLAVTLIGAASTVLSNLLADRRSDYRALMTALENRFGTAHQAELHGMKLRNRTRRREESLAELKEDIERLARLAYLDAARYHAAPGMLELLAKDQFIDSLTGEDMKLKIRRTVLRPCSKHWRQRWSWCPIGMQRARTVRVQRNWTASVIIRQQGCREGPGPSKCTLMSWRSCSGA